MGNIQEVQASVTGKLITDANLRAALKKAKGSGAQMVSWAIKDFTSKGDNYVGVVTSVEIKYNLDGKESSVSFIAKLGPPQPTKVYQDSINYAFVKEARIYQELVPALNTQLTSVGLRGLRLPECYYATWESEEEVIYLQDLRSLGYKTVDRKKVLDLAHTALVLEELARLHAASLLLQVKDGYEDLDVKYPFLNKDLFDVTENTIELSKSVLDTHIKKAIAVLKEFGDHRKALHWLENLKSHAFEKMLLELDTQTRFAVVCHLDCWNNNILFRYDAKGNPAKVMLIDLQLFRRASLAVDIKYLFYHSLSGPDRKTHLDSYLDTYYVSFKSVMEAGGLAMPFTREELLDEYGSKHVHACMWAIMCLPSFASENVDTPEIEVAQKSSEAHDDSSDSRNPQATQLASGDSLTVEWDDNFLLLFRKNPEMTSRFLSLFDEIEGETVDQ